jgi:broad specificity phosphatase PhoE
MAVIYYVEHGDTKYDQNDCAQGLIDDGLTAKGKEQAARAGRGLRGTTIDCVYTSPMKRAKQTADIIAGILKAKVIVLPKLKPLDIGTLAGKKNSQTKPYLEFFSYRRSNSLKVGPTETTTCAQGMDSSVRR